MFTITCTQPDHRETIEEILDGYGAPFRAWLDSGRIRVVVLEPKQRFADVSRELLRATIDTWPVPPAGLFIVAEATVYLRSLSRMTIAHELVHAYDCARGGGAYFSASDPTIRRLFRQARAFVTPYAAQGIDEYVAESGRALHGNGNDPCSPWPRATPRRLQERDPAMYDYLRGLFAQPPPNWRGPSDLRGGAARVQPPGPPRKTGGRHTAAPRIPAARGAAAAGAREVPPTCAARALAGAA